MVPGSDGVADVYRSVQPERPRQRPRMAQKGTKRTKTADIELEINLMRALKKVERLIERYQPHGKLVCEALALMSCKGVLVYILRSGPHGRALKCCFAVLWCVVLAPKLTGHA